MIAIAQRTDDKINKHHRRRSAVTRQRDRTHFKAGKAVALIGKESAAQSTAILSIYLNAPLEPACTLTERLDKGRRLLIIKNRAMTIADLLPVNDIIGSKLNILRQEEEIPALLPLKHAAAEKEPRSRNRTAGTQQHSGTVQVDGFM